MLFILRLYGGNDDRIKDVVHRASARKVIYRLVQPLEHRPDSQSPCFTLYGFVRVMAGGQVGEYEYRSLPGYL